MVVLVLHLHLGKGHVDDGFEGELAGVGPAATEEEEGAEDSEDNTEEDVEEVEPNVDGEEAAALDNLVASLLKKEISSVSVLVETSILLDSLSWFFLLLLMDWSSV